MKKTIHLPGLNGLRAIAALGVVFSHITLNLKSFGVDPNIFGTNAEGNPEGLMLAAYGVSIFFALSGFLITYLLLHERAKQTISIKNFYIRRILRIWPLYYLYFLIVIATLLLFNIGFPKSSCWFYIFLCANIPYLIDQKILLLAHYWSLGVEEQFYAFWPWLVKFSKDKLLKISILLLVCLLILKIGFRIIDIKYQVSLPYYTIFLVRFQCMLIGAIGAMFYFNNVKVFISIASHIATQLISWLIILLIILNAYHILSVVDHEIVCVITVFLIVGQSAKRNRIINLDTSVFDFFGKISYGIYVIHPLIIFLISKWWIQIDSSFLKNYFIIYSVVTGATVLIAHLSYKYYEKGFLRLKLNYTAVKSSGTKHFSESNS